MTDIPELYFQWDGAAMVPLSRFSRLAERSLTSGTTYRMIVEEERSVASHRQYMAAVHEAFMQLPEPWDLAFPNEDALRKYALIKAGYCNVAQVVGNKRLPVDNYALVTNEDGVTTVYTAKSQSFRAMGKEEFAKSKQAVLEVLANMIGVSADELVKERSA